MLISEIRSAAALVMPMTTLGPCFESGSDCVRAAPAGVARVGLLGVDGLAVLWCAARLSGGGPSREAEVGGVFGGQCAMAWLWKVVGWWPKTLHDACQARGTFPRKLSTSPNVRLPTSHPRRELL